MVGKSFKYIFICIYTLLVGCDILDPLSANTEQCENYYLEINAPSLQKDWMGRYHMEWQDGYVQTFATLDAEAHGATYGEYVHFSTDGGMEWPEDSGKWWEAINAHSYTRADGTTNAVFCSWEPMINTTAEVIARWEDDCGNIHTDKIYIIIHNDE